MKNSKRLFTLLILFVSILIFSMLTVSAAVVSTMETDTTTDKIIQIDAKYKQVPTNKVTMCLIIGKNWELYTDYLLYIKFIE